MVLITLSSFLSATIINLYLRADKKNKVPEWLRMVGYYALRSTFASYFRLHQVDFRVLKRYLLFLDTVVPVHIELFTYIHIYKASENAV